MILMEQLLKLRLNPVKVVRSERRRACSQSLGEFLALLEAVLDSLVVFFSFRFFLFVFHVVIDAEWCDRLYCIYCSLRVYVQEEKKHSRRRLCFQAKITPRSTGSDVFATQWREKE